MGQHLRSISAARTSSEEEAASFMRFSLYRGRKADEIPICADPLI